MSVCVFVPCFEIKHIGLLDFNTEAQLEVALKETSVCQSASVFVHGFCLCINVTVGDTKILLVFPFVCMCVICMCV